MANRALLAVAGVVGAYAVYVWLTVVPELVYVGVALGLGAMGVSRKHWRVK